MKAEIRTYAVDLHKQFSGDVSEWILEHSDVGGYYAPTVTRGERMQHTTYREVETVPFLQIEFPNSTLTVVGDHVTVTGRRGSIEDCIVPILRHAGINLDDARWRIETSRPDVPWYVRAEATATK